MDLHDAIALGQNYAAPALLLLGLALGLLGLLTLQRDPAAGAAWGTLGCAARRGRPGRGGARTPA
jgi:hypothetical protein